MGAAAPEHLICFSMLKHECNSTTLILSLEESAKSREYLGFGKGNCSKIVDGDLRIFVTIGQIYLHYISAYHKTPRSG